MLTSLHQTALHLPARLRRGATELWRDECGEGGWPCCCPRTGSTSTRPPGSTSTSTRINPPVSCSVCPSSTAPQFLLVTIPSNSVEVRSPGECGCTTTTCDAPFPGEYVCAFNGSRTVGSKRECFWCSPAGAGQCGGGSLGNAFCVSVIFEVTGSGSTYTVKVFLSVFNSSSPSNSPYPVPNKPCVDAGCSVSGWSATTSMNCFSLQGFSLATALGASCTACCKQVSPPPAATVSVLQF